MPGHAGPRIIYLGGLGRSGTTLIERMLNEIPGIRSVGEVTHLWQRGVSAGELCGCGAPFHDCEFWGQVGEVAFGGWDLLNVDRLTTLQRRVDRTRHIPALARSRRSPPFQQALDEYLAYYLRLYQAIEKTSGHRVLVDSSKHASLAFCLRAAPALDLRVVHVVRDSRAVAYSWSRQVARPDAAGPSYMTVYRARTAAVQWNTQNLALHWLARLGVPLLRIRYEDFVRNPERGVQDIAAFAGIGIGLGALQFVGGSVADRWAELGPAHTASGNPMRFDSGRIPIRPDVRWQTALPARHRRLVTALTLPLFTRYGYVKGVR
jgi:hypothetical protein